MQTNFKKSGFYNTKFLEKKEIKHFIHTQTHPGQAPNLCPPPVLI